MPHRFSQIVIYHSLQSCDRRREEVYVANKTGVQGRFQQAVGQVVGAILESQAVNIRFADFQSAGTGYRKTPDIAMVSRGISANLKAMGEIRAPWIDAISWGSLRMRSIECTAEKLSPSRFFRTRATIKNPTKKTSNKDPHSPPLKRQPRWSPSTSVKPGRLISMPSSMASTATTPRPPPSSRITWHSSARTERSTAMPTWRC